MSIPRDFRAPPTGADSPIVPWRMSPRTVFVVGMASWVAFYAVAQLSATDSGIPGLFLPAGIAVGLLLRLPGRLWWWVVVGMLSVDVIGGTVTGAAAFPVALIWGVSNVTQSALIAGALRWARVDMSRARDPWLILGVSGVIVACVSVAGSLMLSRVIEIRPEEFWADWWGADVLSIVLLVPVLLLLGRASAPRGRLAVEALGWFVAAVLLTGLSFSGRIDLVFPVWVWLILGAPLIVLYGVRFGALAMTVFLFVLDLIAVSFTTMGLGPFQQITLSDQGNALRTVQLVLILLAVSVQSASALIYRSLRHARSMANQQALLDAVIESSPVATALLAPDDGFGLIRTNRAFRELLPASGTESDLLECFPPSERDALIAMLEKVGPATPDAVDEFAAVDAHGEPILIRLRAAGVIGDDFDEYGRLRSGIALTRVLHGEDMTEVRRRESRLERDAGTDPLTGLANRRYLMRRLRGELSQASRDHLVAVAYLDLDGFKEVNDRAGHAAGDEVLRQVADCLQHAVRATDLLARTGGDEFVVVSPGLPDAAAAHAEACRILDTLLSNPQTSARISASVGVAVCDDPTDTPDELLRRADEQMYAAKSLGGARVAGV